ncbi:MAG: pre-peptidase C-terminal domain-containing protein [Thermodesulfobacteriota bacterium]|nr:pre-peptidase C-terminal domain-containing protein [Thermodesulfobacteriota bacterium]
MKAKMRTKKGFVYPRLCWFAGRSLVTAILLIVVLMVFPVNGEALAVDLAIEGFDVFRKPAHKQGNFFVTFSFTVRNIGSQDAGQPFKVEISPGRLMIDQSNYLSATGKIEPVSFTVNKLRVQQSMRLDHTMYLPDGTYQVSIEADPDRVYADAQRDNNRFVTTVNLTTTRQEWLQQEAICQECPQSSKSFQFNADYHYWDDHREFMRTYDNPHWPYTQGPHPYPPKVSIDRGFSVKPLLPNLWFKLIHYAGPDKRHNTWQYGTPLVSDLKLMVFGPGIPSGGQEMTFKWVFSQPSNRVIKAQTKGSRYLKTEGDAYKYILEIPYAYATVPFENSHESAEYDGNNTVKWTFCYRVTVIEKTIGTNLNIPGPNDAWGSYRIGLHDVVGQPYRPAEHAEIGDVHLPRDWERIPFGKAFSHPVVVAKSLSSRDEDVGMVRIRNVDDTGFEIRVQEWDYQDGVHSPETTGYIVMEQGAHTLPDGTRVEAGRFDTNRTSSFERVFFSQDFEVPPVVITAVCSDNEADAVTTRMRNISTTGFEVRMQEQQLNQREHAHETISYIAWEPSSGTIDGVAFEVNRTANKVRHNWHTIALGETYGKVPVFVADMQTTNGGDPANVRWNNKDAYGVDVKITEEQSKDSETFHCREVVGYMAFSQALDQGPADLVEMEHGRPVTDLWAEQGDALYFTIDVPASVSELALESSGGIGDGDVHVRYGAVPTLDEWDYRPYSVGNDEIVKIASPIPGTWHVMIHAYEGFDDVTLGAYFRGLSAPDLWAELGDALYFAIDVPEGASELAFDMYGGMGDGDLYVRYDAVPTLDEWDYRPYQWGNAEMVHIPFPMPGTWHVMIHAYDTFDGVTLEGDYLD